MSAEQDDQDRPIPPDTGAEPSAAMRGGEGVPDPQNPAAEAGVASSEDDLRQENQFLLDQVQRERAELANFRRRTADERLTLRRRVICEVLRELFPVVDDLDKALHAAGDEDGSQLREGVGLILGKFNGVLRGLGIEPISTVGERFDPQWHEAMFHLPTADHTEGQVVEEFQRGYRMGDELVRAARVSVAKAPVVEDGGPVSDSPASPTDLDEGAR